MKSIEKALQDLTKALESNESIEQVIITIKVRKPKPSKATSKPEKAKNK